MKIRSDRLKDSEEKYPSCVYFASHPKQIRAARETLSTMDIFFVKWLFVREYNIIAVYTNSYRVFSIVILRSPEATEESMSVVLSF